MDALNLYSFFFQKVMRFIIVQGLGEVSEQKALEHRDRNFWNSYISNARIINIYSATTEC